MNSSANAHKNNARVTTHGGDKRSQRVLPAGTVLEGRYEVLRVAGRGGMSTVYVARDQRFGQVERLCAVKEMGDNEPDPGTRALSLVNFERESALLATIAHPSVPKIYDYFADGGMIYLVLEFIDGDDLERALAKRKAPFPEQMVVEWAIQICDVLQMLHSYEPAPIIFRDLKPSNIMLRSTGKIALIDFGIARTFQAAQRGTMIGTEGYAPPEQYRGLADARGDIYAFGATLHHLVTNSDPRQQTPFTFHERPIQSLNPQISDEFTEIVTRMVAYHPDQRFQTATELRTALEALHFVERPEHMPRTIAGPLQPSVVAPVPAVVSRVARPERRRPSRKRAARKRSNLDQVAERIGWSASTGDEVRGTATYDGDNIYIGSYDRSLYCLSPEDGTVRWRFETGRGVVARPASSDGRVIVGSEDSAVYCIDGRSGQAIWQHRTSMPVRSSTEVADGLAFVGSDDGMLYAFDIESGEPRWRQRTWGPVRSTPVAVGSMLFVGSDDGYIYALDTLSGEIAWRKQSGGSVQSEPFVSDALVITTSRSGSVIAHDPGTGQRRWIYHASGAVISSPRVEQGHVIFGVADGSLVALSQDDGQAVWVQRYANQITSTPLLGSTIGYVGTIDGACVAFSIDSGEMAWRHDLGGSIVSSPCLGGRFLVVGSTDRHVYGIALAEWELQELTEVDGSD